MPSLQRGVKRVPGIFFVFPAGCGRCERGHLHQGARLAGGGGGQQGSAAVESEWLCPPVWSSCWECGPGPRDRDRVSWPLSPWSLCAAYLWREREAPALLPTTDHDPSSRHCPTALLRRLPPHTESYGKVCSPAVLCSLTVGPVQPSSLQTQGGHAADVQG